MTTCILSSQKEEVRYFEDNNIVQYALNTYESGKRCFSIENVTNLIDVVDVFIIGETDGCSDDFIIRILNLLNCYNKVVEVLHKFAPENEKIILHQNIKNENVHFNMTYNISMPNIYNKPLILIEGVSTDIQKIKLICDICYILKSKGVSCCVISSLPHFKYITTVKSVLVNSDCFETICFEFTNKVNCVIDADVYLLVSPINLFESNKDHISIEDVFYDFLVKKYKPDYSIMCMPHNFDENYLPHVLNKSSQLSQKNIDCIAKMNYIVDSFEYNVEQPNRIFPIDGCAEQFYILRKKIYVNTINDIVLDIIECLK